MAFDPIGLSIGVFGLAGLTSTAIECFDVFRKMRAFGRDAEILAVKLDIEKNLLIQWALRVGLFKRDLEQSDRLLQDKHTRRRIYRILNIIVTLLKDGNQLEEKYGLKMVPARDGEDFNTDSLSRHTLNKLVKSDKNSISDVGSEVGPPYGKQVGMFRKMVWAIHDKDEFRDLIEQIEYFVSKLDEMIPPISDEQKKMMNQSLREIGPDAPTLRLISLAAKGLHDEWSEAASTLADETEQDQSYFSDRTSSRRHRDSKSRRDQPQESLRAPVVVYRQRSRSNIRRSLGRMRDDLLLLS